MHPFLILVPAAFLAACGQQAPKFNAPERSDATLCAAQAEAAKAGRTDGTPITITCPAE
ncbi:MAG: hypothetical protein V4516_15775 [Pseudomonadota bacterium]